MLILFLSATLLTAYGIFRAMRWLHRWWRERIHPLREELGPNTERNSLGSAVSSPCSPGPASASSSTTRHRVQVLTDGGQLSSASTSNFSLGTASATSVTATYREEILETDMSMCSICFHCYNDQERRPLVLPCSHSFCQACVRQLETNLNKFCPNCRQDWGEKGVTDFLCCYQLIPGTSAAKKVVTRCSDHQMEMTCWCDTCIAVVCIKCVQMNHKTCSWMTVHEKRETVQSTGDQAIAKLDEALASIEELHLYVEYVMQREERLMTCRNKAEIEQNKYHALTDEVLDESDLPKLQQLATVIKQIETLTEEAALDPLLLHLVQDFRNEQNNEN